MSTIYLDHSATTPVDPRVLQAMIPYFTEIYGNASSAHYFGRSAENAIEEARETIAAVLKCKPKEIIFTSGGSESDNLAIRGAAWSARQQGKGTHLITTPIEHGAVGKTIDQLAALQGFERTVLPVDQYGFVSLEDFRKACKPGTTLASIMYANNEIGTIQPISELAAIAHEHGALFHTDAVQAAGQLSLDVNELNVDLLSISGHKFYGPKGVGALYIRDGVDITPAQTGGSHERGLRAGTQNTPLIVGLAEALKLAYEELETRTAHYKKVRDQLIGGIIANIPNARLTGHGSKRLPAHASFVFENIQSGALIHLLDDEGIAASAASACKTGSPDPSSVLLALGYSRELAACTLRLTVGTQTKRQDVEFTVKTLVSVVKGLTVQPTVVAQPVLA